VKPIRSMLVLCSAVLIILVLFGTAFTRPQYTSSNLNTPTQDTCAGCHSGTATAGGSAVVVFPSGLSYTAGVTQHLSVKITDPTHTRGGYLLTARLANSVTSQAGTFTATDTNSRVFPNGAIQDIDAVNFGTLTWNFDWTPPAAGSGSVNFYVIGYATGAPGGCCNGNGAYLSTATLTEGAATPDFSLSASPSSLSIATGSSGTSTITITPKNGFTGSVTLSASGMPTGVTAAFGTNPTTATSVLTLTASGTATTGTSTITITGTSGALTHTTTVALTVSTTVTPDFSLSASPNTLTIAQGSNGSSTISVAPQNGFTGSVTLSAAGLPSGVTPSFGTNPTTATSVLTLTASSTATGGMSTVTITGTSGALTHTTTVALTVSGSTLTAAPTMLSFNYTTGSPAPAAQTISVTATPTNLAFTASASGGTWLSAAATKSPTPGTVTVTVNPAGLTAGTYNGTVTITSSGATGSPQSVPVTLMVSALSTKQLNTTPSSSYPNFLIDAQGNYDAVWTDTTTTAGVFFSRSTDHGTSFPTSVMIPGSAGAALQPQIVVDATGNNIDVVWAQSTSTAGSYNVFFSRSTNGGQSFSATPKQLTTAALPLADAPRMALEPSGGVDVVWGRNETWIIRSANGATFGTSATKLSNLSQDSGGPRVAVDSKSTIYVAWTDEVSKSSGSCNFYFNVAASGSTFNASNTRNLSNTDWAGAQPNWPNGFTGCSYDNLILLVDSQDNLHMVWSDDMPDQSVLVSAYDSTGNSRVSFPTSLGSSPAASPHAVVVNNSSGIPTLHVVWSDGPKDITAQATPGIFYTHSTDTNAPFGQTFATLPTRVANAKSEFPQIGVDNTGNIDVVWQQGDALIPGAFDVVLAPSFDGGNTFTLSMPISINASIDCLGPNTTDTTVVPPPPYSTCGSVQLKVDSGNASNLVWVDSGTNILFARQTIPPPPNFAMTLNTPSQATTSGPATYTVTVTAENGFNQWVTITCANGLPSGAGCFTSQVMPSATGTTATVTVVMPSSAVPASTYPFTITGTAGSMTQSVQAMLIVNGANTPDFSVTVPSSSATSLLGQTATYSVNISSTAGFNKPVSISCAGLPMGATCGTSPASVMPSGTATVTVAVSGTLAPGTYPFTITATSGGTNHSQPATLVVGTISANVGPNTSATIAVGSSANFTLSLASTNGSAGPVNLGCGGAPAGISCTFSPTQVNVSPSATAMTTLTVTVTAKPALASVYGSPNAWPNLSPWSFAFSALFLIILTTLFAYRRNGNLPSAVIRGLAVLVLIVVLGAGLTSCGGTTGGGSGSSVSTNSAAAHFTIQGQSGTATMNLGTMSIMVP
jgi:uncharacterized membrane protein